VLPVLSCSRGSGQAAEGQRRVRYRESPMLEEQVQKGLLPPVEERLPKNPLVVEPVEGTGSYSSSEQEDEEKKESP
jgi:hypothetical protein